jgi:hypothetical protein
MPYTKEELKAYQFHLDRVQNQRQKYNDYLDDPTISAQSSRNHIVASGSNTLISFEDIDEEKRKQSPFRRVGLDAENHKIEKVNQYPTFYKDEKYENTIESEINSLIPTPPSLPTVQLANAPNDNVLNPSKKSSSGITITPTLLTPSRTKPNERTDGYTIDLLNGDIIALEGWTESQSEHGLQVYYLEKNRKRRFPTMKILNSYRGTLLGPHMDLEILVIEKDALDFILSGQPMEFNTK